ncbi:hypothetical protein [Pseudomonas sp. MF6747]|uniref:hypothetical protein n=1 Tax=Pseudomonas sp. MF6747 TaxID=2797527 RepID=UPI00190C099A|nr:hypothetical protein [Pseudomonas sp. MF6747]MBK3505750.1 hypothetical protein [Pseudomonas sp. MF6747]
MSLLRKLLLLLFRDKRTAREKAREQDFILAVNSLKTLKTTDRGGMSIDPEELREQIISSREQLKHLVHKPVAPNTSFEMAEDVQVEQETSTAVEDAMSAMDCIEVVAWRRLLTGAAVRYVCLQSTNTGCYAVATASLFSGGQESLRGWFDGSANRKIANALQLGELHWYAAVSEAMDAWDAEL